MNEHFLEHLENAGLINDGIVNASKISRLKISTIADIAQESTQLTSAEHLSREESIFAQSASLSLGGDRTDHCGRLECRLNRAYELAQFASLYSDRVYVRSFFSKYSPLATSRYKGLEEVIRNNFAEDLTIVAQLRPLIEKGAIVPFSMPTNFCPCCLAKLYLNEEFHAPLLKAYEDLKSDYLDKVSYALVCRGGRYFLERKGPEILIDHSLSAFEYHRLPSEYHQFPDCVTESERKGGVILSKQQVSALELHEREANRVMESISFELTAAQTLNTSFLTDRPIHLELLNSINQNPDIERRNRIAQQYLTSFVPFVEGLTIHDLVKLRENEGEAFIVYRQTLNEAIDNYRREKDDFTEKDAKTLYSDIIAPRLAQLDQKVKTARRTFLKETIGEAAAWVGAISFGVYTGIIPAHLIEAAKLLGMTKLLAEFLKSTVVRKDTRASIRNDDLYFLWRVRQAAK